MIGTRKNGTTKRGFILQSPISWIPGPGRDNAPDSTSPPVHR